MRINPRAEPAGLSVLRAPGPTVLMMPLHHPPDSLKYLYLGSFGHRKGTVAFGKHQHSSTGEKQMKSTPCTRFTSLGSKQLKLGASRHFYPEVFPLGWLLEGSCGHPGLPSVPTVLQVDVSCTCSPGESGWHGPAVPEPSFWDAPSIPGAHLAAQTFTGCWESLATHSKFILICAWPKMGRSLKERSATKTRCLSPPEDKSPAIAQATGRKQTQILSSESLAGAGCSILAKRTLPLRFVPAFVRSPLPIKRGLGESHSPWEQPGGAGLAAGGLRRARKTSPKISLLFPARNVTALHWWHAGSICHEQFT